VALLISGVVCGGLWELWNLGARTKWIYSVPYFDEIKIGEMPILGFLGFPPFVLECYAFMNLLSHFRGGRSWELFSAENRLRSGMSPRLAILCAPLMAASVFFGGIAMTKSVASFDLPLDWFFGSQLGPQGIQTLRRLHALQGNHFLKLKQRPPEMSPALWTEMRRVTLMSELKGMGLSNALALQRLKIQSFADLAAQTPAELASKINRHGQQVRVEEVKVWILAARKKVSTGT
jgi:hypothetical protein